MGGPVSDSSAVNKVPARSEPNMPFAKKLALFFVFAMIFMGNDALVFAQNITQQVQISSSPNPVGSGARALGMGGAFIAVADDATAASWNPGGLIQLEKPEVSMVGSWYTRSEDFSSDAESDPLGDSSTDSADLNYLSAVYPFNFLNRNMVVSLNYQRLYDFNRDLNFAYSYRGQYDPKLSYGLTQNIEIKQSGGLIAISPAYCVEVIPNLSFGMTLNFWTDAFFDNGWNRIYSSRGSGYTNIGDVTYNYATGADIRDKYESLWGFNATIGFLWDVSELISIGGVFKTPWTANMHHTYASSEFQRYADSNVTSSYTDSFEEQVELDFPLSYGLGIAFRFSDAFTCSLDVHRTEWGSFAYRDGNGVETSPIDGRPMAYSDIGPTHQVRMGGEYLLILERTIVPLRAGLFYDPEPGEDGSRAFYGFSVGSGVSYGLLVLDAAYQFRFGNNIDGVVLSHPGSSADIRQHEILVSAIYHF